MFCCGVAEGNGQNSGLEYLFGETAIVSGILSGVYCPIGEQLVDGEGDITLQRPALIALIGVASYGMGYGLGSIIDKLF